MRGDKRTCLWCGETFRQRNSKGPHPDYCSPVHRQRAYELRKLVDDMARDEPKFAGAVVAFRLEAIAGLDGDPQDLVGKHVAVDGPLTFEGHIRSVEPYDDPALGPGHWVVIA